VIPTAIVAPAISGQVSTEFASDTHTLLVLNTGTGAPAVLQRISKKSFLADVKVLPGMITQYGAAVAPTGYLLCNGGEHLRATYSDLFAVIGTTYGSSGGLTFRVPNLTSTATGGFTVYHIIKT
jgi:hypothetical protein